MGGRPARNGTARTVGDSRTIASRAKRARRGGIPSTTWTTRRDKTLCGNHARLRAFASRGRPRRRRVRARLRVSGSCRRLCSSGSDACLRPNRSPSTFVYRSRVELDRGAYSGGRSVDRALAHALKRREIFSRFGGFRVHDASRVLGPPRGRTPPRSVRARPVAPPIDAVEVVDGEGAETLHDGHGRLFEGRVESGAERREVRLRAVFLGGGGVRSGPKTCVEGHGRGRLGRVVVRARGARARRGRAGTRRGRGRRR